MVDPMFAHIVSRCLEGAHCKVRDAENRAGQCDAGVFSCIKCGGGMHALYGLSVPGKEEGYIFRMEASGLFQLL